MQFKTTQKESVPQAASNFLLSTSYNLVLQFFERCTSFTGCHAKNKKSKSRWWGGNGSALHVPFGANVPTVFSGARKNTVISAKKRKKLALET
eukprot:g30513.t1